MLRKMEAKGRYEAAKRLRSTCSQIFPSLLPGPNAMSRPTFGARQSCPNRFIAPRSPRP
ncbi:hypothetical protein [Sphingomonas qomolangmaensis]|uniref:Uncharacterized protein n=1 Tax=Sphingomonas qomolangmaensis TaxID=2918765 RepID=A0ABY5LAL3_9SPHN|nr:hypothetical protein [Sphingomonas qomolangmaensis]UUL83181.1 hypothetical protein NMP03_02800 [Sphingomonas qomolangmaensis]